MAHPKSEIDDLSRLIYDLAVTVSDLSRRVDRILFASVAGLVAIVVTLISQLPG